MIKEYIIEHNDDHYKNFSVIKPYLKIIQVYAYKMQSLFETNFIIVKMIDGDVFK